MERFTLQRQSDDLTYVFTRVGQQCFAREDNRAMTIQWEGPWGWVARLPENGVVSGRPWEILPQHQRADAPPAGIWLSRKDGKSYVYRLVPS